MEFNIRFEKISLDDISFINSIRNLYANEYLHDSRPFSVEETKEWFITTSPNYLIIYNNNIRIGYVRLSNYSKVNNNLMVGVDISPEFTGMGYGKETYKVLIPYLFKTYTLNKLSLEVLATNHRAIHLYETQGFVLEGIKREEVLKESGYVNSLIYSILKKEFDNLTNNNI